MFSFPKIPSFTSFLMIMNLAWDILNSEMPEGHSYVVVSKLLDSRPVAQESGLCGRQRLESH